MSPALVKTAVRLFRSDLAPRSVRRHNARQWLRQMHQLGDKHVYKSNAPVGWGYRSTK